MHLRGILWILFRVLLVGFSLFRLGAARAPLSLIPTSTLITYLINSYISLKSSINIIIVYTLGFSPYLYYIINTLLFYLVYII